MEVVVALVVALVAMKFWRRRGDAEARMSAIEAHLRHLHEEQRRAAAAAADEAAALRLATAPLAQAAAYDAPTYEAPARSAPAATDADDALPDETAPAATEQPVESLAEPVADEPAAADTQPTPSPVRPAHWDPSPGLRAPPRVPLSVPTPTEAALHRWLFGGNLIVRVGVVVLFFGVAFLLRYAAEHSHLSMSVRLSGVAAFGVALLGLGWRLRGKRRAYALAVQGAGVGVLYLTVFAAYRLFGLLPPGATFALLGAVAGLSAMLAILEDSLAFAMLGSAGGFLAPLLAAVSGGTEAGLLSYYAELDLAIFAIAWFRSWRPLNLLAFTFTLGVGAAWGINAYTAADLATTEFFLALFFLMFVGIAFVFAIRRPPSLTDYVDGTLIFGTPVACFLLQSAVVGGIPFARAYTALGLAAFYLGLARMTRALWRDTREHLFAACLALGVAFLTLAVPFALSGHWTAAVWALEGAAVFWVGQRQRRWLPVVGGLLVQLLAGIAYLAGSFDPGRAASAGLPLLNSEYLGALMIAAGALISAAVVRRKPDAEPTAEWRFALLSTPLMVWGLVWWLTAGSVEIQRSVDWQYQWAAGVGYAAVTALVASLIAGRLAWTAMRLAALLIVPALVVAALPGVAGWSTGNSGEPWAWALALPIAVVVLRRDGDAVDPTTRTVWHTLLLWLVAYVLAREATRGVGLVVPDSRTWALAARGIVVATVTILAGRGAGSERWPYAAAPRAYGLYATGGLGLWLAAFVVSTLVMSSGGAAPLDYVPLANPIDLAEAFSVVAVLRVARAMRTTGAGEGVSSAAAAGAGMLAFLCLNAFLLRFLHHHAGVPYTLDGISHSTLAQTALTIFWSVLALVGMVGASRAGWRRLWMAGAALLALVVVKLVLVDLAQVGQLLRIVSFLGVGLLMLVIGYVSPLPPAVPEEEA